MAKRAETTRMLKEKIADALLELMQQKPYDKITVEEMTRQAGVGRVTYFRHFASKEEVLVFKYRMLWQRWAAAHYPEQAERFVPGSVRLFLEFHYQYRELCRLIRRSGLRDIIATASYQVIVESQRFAAAGGTDEGYLSRFYASGLAGVLEDWAANGFDKTVDEMTALLSGSICGIG